MSFEFKILGSSSSGNAALLRSEGSTVLIDAGFSGRKLGQMLEEIGESLETVQAVFITHEHTDHIAGLKGLSRLPHIQFFANRDTAEFIQKQLQRPLNWQLFETGSTFTFQDLEVTNFSIPHDAYDPVAYTFKTFQATNPKSLAWVTDLGYVPQLVKERIRTVNTLVIESNYDPELLEMDEIRPWATKQRIQGRHGHLSNEATFELLSGMEDHSWEKVYLAHLSKHCNSLEVIENTFAPLQSRSDSYSIEVVDPSTHALHPLGAPCMA